MDRASSSFRRGSALLMSIGSGYQDLNLIISGLKSMKGNVKTLRDAQATVFQDMTNWACNGESRLLKELFVQMLDLTSMWYDIQTQFADHISEFRSNFEMILEGEKQIESARSRFAETEAAEQKAKKKLKKIQKKEVTGDISSIMNKVIECERQREMAQAEVSQKVQEHETVKLIRVKEGLARFSEAYLTLAHKCVYIFEGHRDMCRAVPDVEGMEMHEITIDGVRGAKDILSRARDRVRRYRNITISGSRQPQRNYDPPPPYSPDNYYPTPAYNPYYAVRPKSTGLPRKGSFPEVAAYAERAESVTVRSVSYLGGGTRNVVEEAENAGEAAGNVGEAAGNAEGTAGNAEGAAGNAGGAEGNAGGTAGNAGGTEGNAEGTAGNAEGTAGNTEGAPGNAGGATGNAEGAPGNAGATAGNAEGAAGNTEGGAVNNPGNNEQNVSEPNAVTEELGGSLLSSAI